MRALIGATVAGILSLLPRSAHAEPPAPFAATAPPPAGAYAPPPYGYPPPPRYPAYFYLPNPEGAAAFHPTKKVWYGWQTLLVFGGATALGLASGIGGGASGNGGIAVVGTSLGGIGLAFGGPIVHWAHGNTGKGFVALGINFGAPLVGGGLGVAIACGAGGCGGEFGGFGVFLGMMFGGGAGLLTALIVDVSVLSYDDKPLEPSSARYKAPGWTLVPDFKMTREKTTFGVAGVF